MPKNTVEGRVSRLQDQLATLHAQIEIPEAVSRKQVVEALDALQASLQELEVAEAELAQQNEELAAAREALEVERHRFRELFERAPVAYLVTDLHGSIQEVNPAAAELLNVSRKALTGKPLSVLLGQDDRMPFWGLLKDLRRQEGRRELEAQVVPYRSEPRTVLVTVQSDEDRPGRLRSLRWVLRDITERKTVEKALLATEERLRHSQKLEAVGRLAGGVAHSFNNLLAAIALHAELLLESGGSDGDRRRHAEEIQKAGERAATLARQLLAFGRKQILQPQPLNVGREIAAMLPMLRRLVGEDVEIETLLDEDAGWIQADLGQLEQVVLNLVVNARDAMPDGGTLRIETAAVEVDGKKNGGNEPLAPGAYVEITVSDTGMGMDKEVLAHLFEPFFTTKDRHKGSGLGLATVHGIVSQSGGSVRVESEQDEGSTFRLYLPRLAAPVEPDRPEPAAQEASAGREVVLLVEDEENIREPAREVLESRGYTVLTAPDASEALQLCQGLNGPLHLLVTDVVMPGMSGSQLAEILCQERPDVRVLFISGYPEDAVARHGVLEAERSFLQKPFPPGVLLRKVREVLDRGGQCSTA